MNALRRQSFSDDFNAEATFEENGTDTIWYYDDTSADETDPYDVIDLGAAIDFVDTDLIGGITEEEMETQLNALFDYDASTGELTTDAGSNVWFNVYEDAGTDAADAIYVEVDGNQFAPIWYWDAGNPTGRSLNAFADDNNIEAVIRKINGGLNGFEDRVRLYTRAALVLLG